MSAALGQTKKTSDIQRKLDMSLDDLIAAKKTQAPKVMPKAATGASSRGRAPKTFVKTPARTAAATSRGGNGTGIAAKRDAIKAKRAASAALSGMKSGNAPKQLAAVGRVTKPTPRRGTNVQPRVILAKRIVSKARGNSAPKTLVKLADAPARVGSKGQAPKRTGGQKQVTASQRMGQQRQQQRQQQGSSRQQQQQGGQKGSRAPLQVLGGVKKTGRRQQGQDQARGLSAQQYSRGSYDSQRQAYFPSYPYPVTAPAEYYLDPAVYGYAGYTAYPQGGYADAQGYYVAPVSGHGHDDRVGGRPQQQRAPKVRSAVQSGNDRRNGRNNRR